MAVSALQNQNRFFLIVAHRLSHFADDTWSYIQKKKKFSFSLSFPQRRRPVKDIND